MKLSTDIFEQARAAYEDMRDQRDAAVARAARAEERARMLDADVATCARDRLRLISEANQASGHILELRAELAAAKTQDKRADKPALLTRVDDTVLALAARVERLETDVHNLYIRLPSRSTT